MKKLLRNTCQQAGSLAAVLILFLAASFLAESTSWAQAIVFNGTVTDAQNAYIPAATVNLRGPGGAKQTKTNDKGVYEFKLTQPGSYTVSVAFPGFAKFEAANIQVGANMVFDIPLVVAMEKQAVDVQDTDQTKVSTDPSQNGSALVLKGADLDMLSDDPDQLADDLSALAGPSAGPNGGQIFIDGFSGGSLPPKSSIREIRVNQNPYSAEFDRLGFGRIEILTRPGTDKFRGQIMFQASDAILNSRNPILNSKPDFQSKFINASLGGPLTKKSSFNLDVERRGIDENAVVIGTILDSNLLAQPFQQGILTPQTRLHITPRVDYALSANNTLVGRYSYSANTTENQGVGSFNLASRAYNSGSADHTIQLTETSILGTHAVNETRFQYDHDRNHRDGSGTSPTINVLSAFTGGSPSVGPAYDTLKHIEVSNMTTYNRGSHVFKFGARARHYSVEDNSPANYNGTFSFSGGTAPALDANNQIISGQTILINSIEQYRRTLYFQKLGFSAAQVRAYGGGATQFSLAAGNPLASVNQSDIGIFALDDWRIKPNFTLSYGLRYEVQTNSSDHRDISPRLSIAWGIGGTGKKAAKTVLRAGVGVFYDRLSQNLTLNAFRNNGINQQQYIVQQPDFFPILPSLATLAGNLRSTSITEISNSMVSPYIAQGNIGIDRQLPRNITVALNYIYSTSAHSLRSRNINAPILALGGLQPYGPASGNIFLYESSGRAQQNQFLVNVNARVNRRVQMFGFFMVQNAHSNTDGLGSAPAYQYDESTEWGRSSFAPRLRGFMGGSLQAWKKISLAPHIMTASGTPFNITTGRDTNGDTYFNERPALATNASTPGVIVTRFGNFNPTPGPGDALIPRNFATGPSSFTVNLRVARTWGFGERAGAAAAQQQGAPGGPGGMMGMGGGGPRGGGGGGMRGGGMGGGGESTGKRFNVTLSASARNLLNHANYGIPISNLSSNLFGTYNSLSGGGGFGGPGGGGGFGGGGGGAGAAGNRRIDLSLRFSF